MPHAARKRPLAVTVIGWLFIAVGAVALGYHLLPQHSGGSAGQSGFKGELLWVCAVRVLALVSGVFLLRGCNWARWLLVVWMAYHIALSFLHSPMEVVMHLVIFGTVAFFLFRPAVSAYLRQTGDQLPPTSPPVARPPP